MPEPAASSIKKIIRFEMLDQPKSASKSNKARSPNAVKVAAHQPFENLMGLVMVTNAEKVVLERVQIDEQGTLFEESEDEKDKLANELRNLIGKIPNLQILIDEVHHAATDDIKLRQVVNAWSRKGNINGVLGFSGTPYLSSPENVAVGAGMSVKFSQITNTVFYYPLTRAIEGFLKKPTVRTLSEVQSSSIVRRGVEEFLAQYGDKNYRGGQTAKLAIYCGTIERLENEVFPMLLEMGIAADDILKYHRGNKQHKISVEAEREWRTLDTALSRKRIILLVQIGKEGWDCRSLTGVILSQKGDCPTNMVLQTSCRCLRQMDGLAPDGLPESAGIWLNADNAKALDKQLKEEQHTSIEEINKLGKSDAVAMRPRISRVDYLKLPPVDFYQMRVLYSSETTQQATPQATIAAIEAASFKRNAEVQTGALGARDEVTRRFLDDERGEIADFNGWLLSIARASFNALSMRDLRAFEGELRALFDAITYDEDGVRRFNAQFNEAKIATRVRLAFHDRRTLHSTSEVVKQEARLLIVGKLKEIAADKSLYPSEEEVETMRTLDESGQSAHKYLQEQNEQHQKAFEALKAQGLEHLLPAASSDISAPVRNKERSFHFAPYLFASSFEEKFLRQALSFPELGERGLELYFNGEKELTEFRIDCYARVPSGWSRVGLYTPDFLLVERKNGAIHRALIVETKGKGFSEQTDFVLRRKFVEGEFLKLNKEKFGYARFDYLYLSDADDIDHNLRKLHDAARAFFGG